MEIASIDAFQGREKDVVIISAVRSNNQRKMGFLDDFRRLNVSITRARCGLVIIGNADCLSTDLHWSALISNYSARKLLVEDFAGPQASEFDFRQFYCQAKSSSIPQVSIDSMLVSEFRLGMDYLLKNRLKLVLNSLIVRKL